MKKFSIMFLLSAGLILSLTGCEKDPIGKNGDNNAINFSAMVSGGPTTKTVYTGDVVGDWERIDWKEGDPLLIWSDNAIDRNNKGDHYATYHVSKPITSHTYSNDPYRNQSWAIMADYSDLGLVYDDAHENDKFKFWSIYPAGAAKSPAPVGGNAANVNQVIFDITNPASFTKDADKSTETASVMTADMSKAVMLAAVEGLDDGSKDNGVYYYPASGTTPGVAFNSDVVLRYYPAFTAFEVNVKGDGEDEIEIRSVKISSKSSLTGAVTALVKEGVRDNGAEGKTNVVGASTYTIDDAAAKEMTVSFPAGTKISNSKSLSFTLFALPQDINDLVLDFTYSNNTSVKVSLRHKDEIITFAACKKNIIKGLTLPSSINHNVELVFQVMPWEDVNGTITYGPDPIVNAVALEYVSGAQITTGGGRRRNNNFASADAPIKGYFYVYSPTGASWKITVTGDTSDLVVTSSTTGASSSTSDGTTTITGPTGGRVDFTITRGSGASASSEIKLNFSVVKDGREVSINSEITRGNALTITGKVGN